MENNKHCFKSLGLLYKSLKEMVESCKENGIDPYNVSVTIEENQVTRRSYGVNASVECKGQTIKSNLMYQVKN